MILQPGTRLPYALQRSSSRTTQIIGTVIVSAILGGIVAVIFTKGSREIPFLILGGVFALASLLTLASAIRRMFALRTPQTMIEVDRETFTRGGEMQILVRQPGPATIESLRGNLAGEESWYGQYGRKRFTKQLGPFPLFDCGAFEAPYENVFTIKVPRAPQPEGSKHTQEWRLDVSGKVRGSVDFQHSFPVTVA
jgi:hypothetical protein